MPKFYDQSRAMHKWASGYPCWVGSTYWALPNLFVLPMAQEGWCRVQVHSGERGFSITIMYGELPRLLKAWYEDPETTLRVWFKGEPPLDPQPRTYSTPLQPGGLKEIKSLEDLGF